MAAPLPTSGAPLCDTVVQGIAACFLPLPVRTGLPVHVNGYFELSSNRRDIWSGSDMAGAGKLRSEWNVCLLTEVGTVRLQGFMHQLTRKPFITEL